MARPGALRSRVAVFLCLALFASLLPPVFSDPGPPKAHDGRLRIAVGECSDGSDCDLPGIADALERALRKSLAGEQHLRLVSLQDGDPQRVLSARIASLTTQTRRPAKVQIIAESADPLSGTVAYRTSVSAEGAVRPGEERVARVGRAVDAAAVQIVAQVARAEVTKGHIIGTPRRATVILDLGATDGMTLGTELEVIREGAVIARVRIERTSESTSTGRLFDVQPGAGIEAGDDVRVSSIASPNARPTPKKRGGKNKTAAIFGILIAGGLLAILLSGGGGDGGGGAGQLTLVAADPNIPADGVSQTTITATFKDTKGRPLPDGTLVQFETNLGLIVPAEAPLTGGQVQTTLTSSPIPGTAVVRATSGGRRAKVRVIFGRTPEQIPPASVSVISDALEIPADGKSTATITAIVADATHNPAPDDTQVRFRTTLGLVTPGTAFTKEGVAQATLRSTPTPGTARVIIRTGALVERITVKFVPSGDAGRRTLFLTRSAKRIPADGYSTATISATVRNASNNPVPDGTLVRFTTNAGTVFPAQVGTVDGVANATLRSEPKPTRAVVTVAVGNLTAKASVVFEEPPPAASLNVLKSVSELPADGQSTATITAVVADSRNNPVADGTNVSFRTTLGVITPAVGKTTTGIAEATLMSATQAGTATIIVRVGTLRKAVKVNFVASGDSGNRTLFLTRSKMSMPADGQSTVTIRATVKNAKNNPVADGTQVQFTSTAGTIFPARAGTVDGVAAATLRSDTTPGKATVTARVGKLTARITVRFIAGGGSTVTSVFLTRDPAEIPGDGISTSSVTATVRGSGNTPVPDDTPVVFTASRGLISPSIGLTENGKAEAVLRSEPTSTDLTSTVTAVAGSQQAVTTVKFTGAGGGPTQISLIADRTNIPADRASTATLRGTLVDATGKPVAGANIQLAATTGRLQVVGAASWQRQVTAKTDKQGGVEVLLRSTLNPNTSTVTASAPTVTSDTASVTVAFTSLVITNVVADPTSVPVGGNKSSKVTASVVDTIGNPAPNGTVVEFSIINQAQLPSATITKSASTADGKATAIFRSGAEVGTARIRVEVTSVGAVNDQTIIGITAGPPALMTVAADKFVTSARVISRDQAVKITALVSDKFDNPVEDGTAVRFDVAPNAGAVITGTSTTSGGFAAAELYPTGWVGDVTVIASTTGAGGAIVDNSARPLVVHMGGAPVSVVIIAPNAAAYSSTSPLMLFTEADQKIVVQLKDSSGGPADPLAVVTFQVDRGDIDPDPAQITAPLAGTATATFRSDQPTPAGSVDRIVAVSEGTPSAPLYIFIDLNPAP